MPEQFPPEVVATAAQAATRDRRDARTDRRDLALVTIDPEGSRDLDQAFHAAARGSGFRVSYAIADVAGFVAPADPVDEEARERGVTRYSPDGRAPLHPPVLSEHAASLLPDQDTPALLWTIDLDGDGAIERAHLEPATVRSRRALSYPQAQQLAEAGSDPVIGLLARIGIVRREQERARGGISLNLPDQEIEPVAGGGWRLAYRRPLPIEDANAQISLLTGIAAAGIMLEAGVGILRTLPPAPPEVLEQVRLQAAALGVAWPTDRSYAEFVAGLDASDPAQAALTHLAATALRGAGYAAFDGDAPDQPLHAALATPYAHVTAPLRRLVDRFANEVVLGVCRDEVVPGWARAALPELPALMATATQRAAALERAMVDYVEAVVLAPRVGEVFSAMVVRVSDVRATVQLADPPVVATIQGLGLAVAAGDRVDLRLVSADPDPVSRAVDFVPA